MCPEPYQFCRLRGNRRGKRRCFTRHFVCALVILRKKANGTLFLGEKLSKWQIAVCESTSSLPSLVLYAPPAGHPPLCFGRENILNNGNFNPACGPSFAHTLDCRDKFSTSLISFIRSGQHALAHFGGKVTSLIYT